MGVKKVRTKQEAGPKTANTEKVHPEAEATEMLAALLGSRCDVGNRKGSEYSTEEPSAFTQEGRPGEVKALPETFDNKRRET